MGACSSKDASPSGPNTIKSDEISDALGVVRSSPWETYERRNVLGEGGFSKIYRGRHRTSGKSVAIKMLDKTMKHSRDTFFVEVRLLRAIDHENVISMYETYEDKYAFYIVLDLMRGKDLFDVLDSKRDVFPESTAAQLMRTMAQAVHYCHTKNIVHLDLKPENFVFAKESDIERLVLVDFGLGRVVRDDSVYKDRVGSMQYIAPEMIDDNSVCTGTMLKACDMWSLGVILYILVTGLIPFGNWDEVKTGRLRLSKNMSKELRDLIRGLLTRDTHKRLTALQVLEHPWITGMTIADNPVYQAVREGISVLHNQGDEAPHPLLPSLLDAMRVTTDVEGAHEIDALMREFDEDIDGILNQSELSAMLIHFTSSPCDSKASRPTAENALAVFRDLTGGRAVAGRREIAHLATIGMLSLKTPSSVKYMSLTFGQRKLRRFVTQDEVHATFKKAQRHQVSALFVGAPVQDSRKVLSFADLADFLLPPGSTA